MNSLEILSFLENSFDKEAYKKFVIEFFKDLEFLEKDEEIPLIFEDHIKSLKYFGNYKDKTKKNICVLSIEFKNNLTVQRARSKQRAIVAKYLKKNNKDAALCAFYSQNEPNWRLSFVKIDYKYDENHKVIEELSPAKRFSFLVGEGESLHTAKSRLKNFFVDEAVVSLATLEEAFSVEKISKEFYKEYFLLYENLRDRLTKDNAFRNIVKDKLKTESEEETKTFISNFAKKILGQIVFLYFIQKKGWLGVLQDKKWGEGDKDFLKNLFKKSKSENSIFFNKYLEPLLYNTLNNPRSYQTDPTFSKTFNSKIPFLNGGLFEPIYDWEKSLFVLENDFFERVFAKFDLYNFTVNEEEPLEKEVAVDPEIMGRIFENLIEDNLRKEKGTYYTPREIIHFMCKESLSEYLFLQTKLDIDSIEFFLKDHYDEFQEEKYKPELNEMAQKIENALEDIKIIDPACGSGAFLIGLIHEILNIKKMTSHILEKQFNEYEVKKTLIENSIYGVDIDGGAIDIARLRLWLSLIVDYEMEEIKPLPNLDYKIMQGNSLLETVKIGDKIIKLFDEREGDAYEETEMETIIKHYEQLKNQLFNEKLFERKKELREELKKLENKWIEINAGFILRTIENHISEFEKKHKPPYNKAVALEHNKLIEESSKAEEDLKRAIENKESHFLWHLYFEEVFDQKKGDQEKGFDIVIANPPYIQLQKNYGQLANLYKDNNYKTFDRMGDIYCLFYEKGMELLKNNGLLCFISSNKWMRAGYGEKLRQFFSKQNPKILIDLGPGIFESATVDTGIIIIQKSANKNELKGATLTANAKQDIKAFIQENAIQLRNMNEKAWFIGSDAEQKLKEKIEKIGKPLKNWDVKIYRGVLTGFNEAFIIDTATKEKLCKENPKSIEILKPILRGRDIGRYYYKWAGLWVIKIESRWTNKNRGKQNPEDYFKNTYPAIYKHLMAFKDYKGKGKGLINRDDQGDYWWELRDCDYYDEFEKEKIVWQELAQGSQFSFDSIGEFYISNTAYILTGKNLKYILGYLNSQLNKSVYDKWYGTNIGNKGTRWLNQHVQEIPLPPITSQNQLVAKQIESSVDKILSAKKENPDANTTELEKDIDTLVYNLYNLTDEEIFIVENNKNDSPINKNS